MICYHIVDEASYQAGWGSGLFYEGGNPALVFRLPGGGGEAAGSPPPHPQSASSAPFTFPKPDWLNLWQLKC